MTDEEALFAYVDGELAGQEKARVEAAIAADPRLQMMAAEHRALSLKIGDAFSTVLDEPVPIGLSAALALGPSVVSLAEARAHSNRRRLSWTTLHWGTMAATLVAGVIGGLVVGDRSSGPITERGGQLLASGSLERALSTQLASSQSKNALVRIDLTFRNHNGEICRSFAAETVEGVACRKEKEWQLKGLLARERARSGEYRLAASAGAAELIDSLIAGDAMDSRQEKAAQATGWDS